MIWFALLLLVQFTLGAAPVNEIEVSVGETVVFQSAKYPDNDAPGTHRIWKLTTDSDALIQVTCEDVNVAGSRHCKDGFLDVTDSGMGAWCGGLKGITITSTTNTMMAEWKLSKVPGNFKCSAKGVTKNESDED